MTGVRHGLSLLRSLNRISIVAWVPVCLSSAFSVCAAPPATRSVQTLAFRRWTLYKPANGRDRETGQLLDEMLRKFKTKTGRTGRTGMRRGRLVGAWMMLLFALLVFAGDRLAWGFTLFDAISQCTGGGYALTRFFDKTSSLEREPNVTIDYPQPIAGSANPLCALIYIYDDQEHLQECCGCPVSVNGLLTIRLHALTDNPVDHITLKRGLIHILPSPDSSCDPTSAAVDPTTGLQLRAWLSEEQFATAPVLQTLDSTSAWESDCKARLSAKRGKCTCP